MTKDEVFKESVTKPSDFKFNNKVAGVFDDMVVRSVPYYEEVQMAEMPVTAFEVNPAYASELKQALYRR